MHKIRKVEPTPLFEIICTFDDDSVKKFDLKPFLKKTGSMLKPLRKISYFKRVFLGMGVPTWPNGYDICADLIYAEGKEIKRVSKRPKKKPAA